MKKESPWGKRMLKSVGNNPLVQWTRCTQVVFDHLPERYHRQPQFEQGQPPPVTAIIDG
jgi:hypothetical protein